MAKNFIGFGKAAQLLGMIPGQLNGQISDGSLRVSGLTQVSAADVDNLAQRLNVHEKAAGAAPPADEGDVTDQQLAAAALGVPKPQELDDIQKRIGDLTKQKNGCVQRADYEGAVELNTQIEALKTEWTVRRKAWLDSGGREEEPSQEGIVVFCFEGDSSGSTVATTSEAMALLAKNSDLVEGLTRIKETGAVVPVQHKDGVIEILDLRKVTKIIVKPGSKK